MPKSPPSLLPKISVVMSVYNGEQYLASAIESILQQSFDDFEFIIINDGSTDQSPAILKEYAQSHASIRLIHQENTGLTKALIAGCKLARGEYIARMDADDLSMPARFEKQVALLDGAPQMVAATGDVEHFMDDGSIRSNTQLRHDPKLIRLYNCFCNYIGGHGQVMFRRNAYEQAGGYDPDIRFAQDYDLWTRLLRLGDFGNVEELIYRFRTGHDSITSRSTDEQASHSLKTCQREFERLTGKILDKDCALVLNNFWWMKPPIMNAYRASIAASRAMRKAAKIFFRENTDLHAESYGFHRGIAARWWWWSNRVPPISFDRLVFLFNFLVWGVRAIFVRLRHGGGS